MKADLVWILHTSGFGGNDRPRDKIAEMKALGMTEFRMSYDKHKPGDTYLEGWREKPADPGPRPWETGASTRAEIMRAAKLPRPSPTPRGRTRREK